MKKIKEYLHFGRWSFLFGTSSVVLVIVGIAYYGGINRPPGPPKSGFYPYWFFNCAVALAFMTFPFSAIAYLKKRQQISATIGILFGFIWILFLYGLSVSLNHI
ncbi:MAG: hypothetical protein ACXVCE_16605 [Bacteriovorax sp.]